MKALLEFFVTKSRATLLLMVLVVFLGARFYISLPKESTPDVVIPIVLVSTNLNGISAQDSERLLVKPMEEKLRSIEGLKEIKSFASDGVGYVVLSFVAGFDIDGAVDNTRALVDSIVNNLPEEATRPMVQEVNLGLFPILSVVLSGDIDTGVLLSLAKEVAKKIELIPSVLTASVINNRKDVVEILIDPKSLQAYNINVDEVLGVLRASNVLLPTGGFETGHSIKISGAIKTIDDVMNLPVKADKDSLILVRDVAEVRLGLEDKKGLSRFNGKNSVTIDISKRTGENIMDTTFMIKLLVSKIKEDLPKNLKIDYVFDQSLNIINMLNDLENSVVFATLLVVIIVMLSMNLRSALIVAFSIPGAFLICVIGLWMMGITINMVVLFSLIIAVGMLVDNAIIVNEYADRRMILGQSAVGAYKDAAIHMLWPIFSSTMTTLVVFLPLLFWPGVVGQFMKYLPITLICSLSGSLIVSLIFIPVLGGIFGKPSVSEQAQVAHVLAMEKGDFVGMGPIVSKYYEILCKVLERPRLFVCSILGVLAIATCLYYFAGNGVIFFPYMEPDRAVIEVSSKGSLSVEEKDKLVRDVESRLSGFNDSVKDFYTVVGSFQKGLSSDIYLIGKINLEFKNWQQRAKAKVIISEIWRKISDVPGISLKIKEEKKGPSPEAPVFITVSAKNLTDSLTFAKDLTAFMFADGGFVNVETNLPSPEIEWQLKFEHEKAARAGVSLISVSNYVSMLTNGLVATKYRSDVHDDELDVLIRFKDGMRSLSQLGELFIESYKGGRIPLSHLVTLEAQEKVVKIDRIDGVRLVTVKSDVADGLTVAGQLKKVREFVDGVPGASAVQIAFKGEAEDQAETRLFLSNAFLFSLLGIALILMLEFNSFYQTFVIMTAIFLSVTGVIIGLLISGQAFGMVMCGVGIITLAGVVVNNNILLIDAYKSNVEQGIEKMEAVAKAAVTRFRPIMLTSGTTVIGLVPMMLGLNIDFFALEVTYDAPSSQLWQQLSVTIAGGLSFATILSLFFTPSLLIINKRV